MAEIFLNISGDGTATCDAVPPLVDGEQFTIRFFPDGGAELLDVRAFDSHDYSVALPAVTNNQITMNYRSTWGNLYVDIYFSGSTPPGPGPGPSGIPIWLLKKAADNNNPNMM